MANNHTTAFDFLKLPDLVLSHFIASNFSVWVGVGEGRECIGLLELLKQ